MTVSREELDAVLERHVKSIKEHISDKLDPISENLQGHSATLYGKDGRNGLVGDVTTIKTTGLAFKWIAGSGFFAGISKWIHEFYK